MPISASSAAAPENTTNQAGEETDPDSLISQVDINGVKPPNTPAIALASAAPPARDEVGNSSATVAGTAPLNPTTIAVSSIWMAKNVENGTLEAISAYKGYANMTKSAAHTNICRLRPYRSDSNPTIGAPTTVSASAQVFAQSAIGRGIEP